MHGKEFIQLLSMAALVSAGPVRKIAREVPQEHSHEAILTSVTESLNLDNPDNIADPVFALLGNDAAADGLGKIADPDCLQQATADQAFTNAKAAGDVQGMTDALIYRTLERNSGSVGQKTAACTSIEAVNPEIAALQQHQDPASAGAAAANKQIALDLATQIAGIGGDPQEALKSGTFEPGEIGDPTAAGNTCNEADDPEGCIFSQNLIVEDATAAEIDAAAAGAGGNAAAGAAAGAAGAADAAGAGAADTGAADATGAAGAADAAGAGAGTGAAGDAAAGDAAVADAAAANTAAAAAVSSASASASVSASASASATPAAAAGAAATDAAAAAGMDDVVAACVAAAAADATAADAAATAATAVASASASASATASAAAEGANAAVARRSFSRRFHKRAEALGECAGADASIAFGVGFDGREDESFQPNDLETFNHGSAQNIGIVADFICGQLSSSCKASEEAVASCEEGAAAASQLEGQDAADAFNAALAVPAF